MQLFGLVGLLITIFIAVWWLTSTGPVQPPSDSEAATSSQTTTYGDVLNAAEDAARSLEH